MILAFGSIFVAVLAVWAITTSVLQDRRINRLATFRFPGHIVAKVQATYPHLTPDDCQLVMQGLQQFFALTLAARGRQVAMPSQAVDTAWHEFILSTRAYQRFCRQVLGRFLHHTPAQVMSSPQVVQEGLDRAWRLACEDEGRNPKKPAQLPLLFALDAQLAIPGGFFYALNCGRGLAASPAADGGAMIYCASHFGCSGGGGWSSGCGGDSGGHGHAGHGCGGHGGCGGGP